MTATYFHSLWLTSHGFLFSLHLSYLITVSALSCYSTIEQQERQMSGK